jgi:hypothetical protein
LILLYFQRQKDKQGVKEKHHETTKYLIAEEEAGCETSGAGYAPDEQMNFNGQQLIGLIDSAYSV